MASAHINSFQPIASEIIQMSEKDQAMRINELLLLTIPLSTLPARSAPGLVTSSGGTSGWWSRYVRKRWKEAWNGNARASRG